MKELTSPTVPLAAFPEEYRQFESTRVLYGPRIHCLVVHVSLLRPHHSLGPPAGRADRMERSPSHLVSHSVLLPDFSNSSSRVPLRSVRRMGIAVLAWSMVLVLLTTSLTSLWLFLQPPHSRDIYTGMSKSAVPSPFSFNLPTRLQGPFPQSSHI